MLNYPLVQPYLVHAATDGALLVFVVLGVIVLDRLVSGVPRLVDSAMGMPSRSPMTLHLSLREKRQRCRHCLHRLVPLFYPVTPCYRSKGVEPWTTFGTRPPRNFLGSLRAIYGVP